MPGHSRVFLVAAAVLAVAVEAPAAAQRAGGGVKAARADFADMAKGIYAGEVLSDARGSPRRGVRLTVTRTGPNQVKVTSDYARLPAFTARLIRTTDALQDAGGSATFLLDLATSPRVLRVTVDGASWMGVRE